MTTFLVAILHLSLLAIGAAWGAQRTWKACVQATAFLALTKGMTREGVDGYTEEWKCLVMEGARYDRENGRSRTRFGGEWKDDPTHFGPPDPDVRAVPDSWLVRHWRRKTNR